MAKVAAVVALTGALFVMLFELVYRYQVADTYATELRAYNDPEELKEPDRRRTLLAMGDSLTAGRSSYPSVVRRLRPDLRVINSGLPGTGVLQAGFVAPGRFRAFRPSLFVYQINVGNDLLNVRYPISWRRLPVTRNGYWAVVHRFRSLEYLNYRAGQLIFALRHREQIRALRAKEAAVERPLGTDCVHEGAFDVERFTPRVRTYIRGEPGLYEDQVLIRGRYEVAFARLLAGLSALLERCDPASCEAFLLVVPHASQVSRVYLDRLERLGARFDDPDAVLARDYPFIVRLREWLGAIRLGHVRVIDALAVLRARELEGVPVFFLHDPHLNACGQWALGELVAAELGPGG